MLQIKAEEGKLQNEEEYKKYCLAMIVFSTENESKYQPVFKPTLLPMALNSRCIQNVKNTEEILNHINMYHSIVLTKPKDDDISESSFMPWEDLCKLDSLMFLSELRSQVELLHWEDAVRLIKVTKVTTGCVEVFTNPF
jgi:hypothetical protein